MESNNNIYEVLSPWAEADPVPARGLAGRVKELEGKTIGFFRNSKRAARPIFDNLEQKLKRRIPSISFSEFVFLPNDDVLATDEIPRFEEWLKGVDAVVLAYGD
ncbi:MAG: hypothetical protein JXA46_08775 [Dehalococcoidales bacterium]|nr:hypothetical protein [Dehalococcoidales bacterium]